MAKNKADKFVLSDKAIPNEKFIISKYLTSIFQSLPIKKRIRDKFYFRLRQLLMDKLVAIRTRQNNHNINNRETSTFIKFSYKRSTWYLGFYVACIICSNVCAKVMLLNRNFCGRCCKIPIVTPKVDNKTMLIDWL